MNGLDRLRAPADYLDLVKRRAWIMIGTAFVVLALVLAYTARIVPLYSSSAQLEVDVVRKSPLVPDGTMLGRGEDGIVEAQMRRIGARDVAATVVDRLGLANDPEWNNGRRAPDRRGAAIATLQARLSVSRDETAPVIIIETRARDPRTAAAIVNAAAAAYLALAMHAGQAITAEKAVVLERQLRRLGEQVRAADDDLARYRAAHRLAKGSATMGSALDQQTAALAANLAGAQADAAAARARASAASSLIAAGRPDAVAEVLQSPVMTELRRQRAEVSTQAAEIRVRYGAAHPRTARVDEQLAAIDASLAQEEKRIVAGLRSSAAAAGSRAGTVAGEVATLRTRQAEDATASVGADSLERVAEARRATYVQLAQSASATAQERELTPAPARVMVAGYPADVPIYPKTALLLALGGIAAAALSIAAALLVEAFDSKIFGGHQVHALVGVRPISSLAMVSGRTLRRIDAAEPWDYVLARPMSAYTEALRSVRTRLLQSKPLGGGQVVCVTSSIPHEGKSTLSVSLARTMALAGDRVLVVDCDLRRAGLSRLVAAAPACGLHEVLAGTRSWEEVVVRDGATGLDVLPLAGPRFTPHDVFGDGAMRQLLAALRARYDCIVIDAPPVLVVDDAVTLARLADRVLMAVRWGFTRMEALRIAVERLRENSETVIGIVLTAVDPRAPAGSGHRGAEYYMTSATGYHLN